MKIIIRFAIWICCLSIATSSYAEQSNVSIASATTIESAGLYAEILPAFTRETGIQVRVRSVGTGHAINMARAGDADILLVHHTPSEQQFVEEGYGVKRFDLMYNNFVLVGPPDDPASVSGLQDIYEAMRKIAQSESRFVSRADDSGTHKKEQEIWRKLEIDAEEHSGRWYFETGSGMGATLNLANGMNAYTLSDRGTWLRNSSHYKFPVLVEGDPVLFNQYGVVLVNPDTHPHVNVNEGVALLKWLLSDRGQSAINDYRIDGEQAFFANAGTDYQLGQTYGNLNIK